MTIGKIGKSILFDPNKWGALGGDNEAPILYETLFHKNPDVQFYIIGLSDYSRLSVSEQNRINKHGNVIDVWKDKLEWLKNNRNFEEDVTNIEYLRNWTNNNADLVKSFDYGLFFAGPAGTANVLGKTTMMKNPNEITSTLMMNSKYAGPIIEFLNTTKIPWQIIVNDPRYFPGFSKDLMHPPFAALSQYNEIIKFKHRKSYTDNEVFIKDVTSKYATMETIFLIGKDKQPKPKENLDAFFNDDVEDITKTTKFMIVCNEGRPSRYPILKDYILDHIEDVQIYGKWDPRSIGDDSRFMGPKKFNELQSMLQHVKYTFCIPIKRGWATAKFWEMLNYDIIPFVHPSYDSQGNIGFPDILRVKNSKDLFDKINHLENDSGAYVSLLSDLKKLIRPEYYSGDYLNNLIMNSFKEAK